MRGETGEEGGDWKRRELVVVLGQNSDNKYILLETRLFTDRWIYIPLKSKPTLWVKPGLLLRYL